MEGLWPGVSAIVGDADFWCPDCARARYGEHRIDALIMGTLPTWIWADVEQVKTLLPFPVIAFYYETTGDTQHRLYGEHGVAWMKQHYPKYVEIVRKEILNPEALDQEGNPLGIVLGDSDDLHGQYCAGSYGPLSPGDDHQEPYELCDCGNTCYGEGRYEYYNEHGTWPDEEEEEA